MTGKLEKHCRFLATFLLPFHLYAREYPRCASSARARGSTNAHKPGAATVPDLGEGGEDEGMDVVGDGAMEGWFLQVGESSVWLM